MAINYAREVAKVFGEKKVNLFATYVVRQLDSSGRSIPVKPGLRYNLLDEFEDFMMKSVLRGSKLNLSSDGYVQVDSVPRAYRNRFKEAPEVDLTTIFFDDATHEIDAENVPNLPPSLRFPMSVKRLNRDPRWHPMPPDLSYRDVLEFKSRAKSRYEFIKESRKRAGHLHGNATLSSMSITRPIDGSYHRELLLDFLAREYQEEHDGSLSEEDREANREFYKLARSWGFQSGLSK